MAESLEQVLPNSEEGIINTANGTISDIRLCLGLLRPAYSEYVRTHNLGTEIAQDRLGEPFSADDILISPGTRLLSEPSYRQIVRVIELLQRNVEMLAPLSVRKDAPKHLLPDTGTDVAA